VYNNGAQSYLSGPPAQQIPPIPNFTPPAQGPQKKKGNRWKLVLGIVAGVVVLLVVACVGIGLPGSRGANQAGSAGFSLFATPAPVGPASTLTTYCNALKSQDYQTAYNQLDGVSKNKYTENDFALFFDSNSGSGKVTACTVGPSTTASAQGTGSINFTYAGGTTGSSNYTLVKNSVNWEITNVHASAPHETLNAYCSAVARHDYRSAHNQLASQAKAAVSEAQIANQMQSAGVTGCTFTKPQESAASANSVVTYNTSFGATQAYATTLINENGTWKILNQKQQ
jgi:limonene-1,2-epoxide hydrolase